MLDAIKETNDEYHSDTDRLSNSMLSVLKKCPQAFEGLYITKTIPHPEQTEAMALGHVVHCMVLEPQEFRSRFAIKPEGIDRRTKEGKAAWAALVETSVGKEIITQEDYNTAKACAKSLLMHDQLSSLWSITDGIIEERIDFIVEGAPFRCKPDLVLPKQSLIMDVKTTRDASPGGFAKSVAEFGYHRQASLYRDAAAMKYGQEFRFLFAVVTTTEPHEVACYELSGDAITAGMNESIALVQEYQTRMKTNNWLPSWSIGVVEIGLPKFYKSNVFELDEVAV